MKALTLDPLSLMAFVAQQRRLQPSQQPLTREPDPPAVPLTRQQRRAQERAERKARTRR